jgi:hypothetical protein
MHRSRRMLGAAVVAGTLLTALPAAGQSSEWRLTPGGWVSGSVDYVTTIEEDAGTALDAVLYGDNLFVTSWRSFSIYDLSDPLEPQRLSTTPLGAAVYNEQPQTNGQILLVSRDLRYLPPAPGIPPGAGGGALEIYDVRNKEEPAHLATYESVVRDHLWACVLDCSYAYSASGTILDLGDPSTPTVVGNWSQRAPYRPNRFHHIAEVAPGIVMTGSLPMHVLDARKDPTSPVPVASTEPRTTVPGAGVLMPETVPARVSWPGATSGRLALVTMESPFSGPCNERSGDFQTFVTTGWRGSGTFQAADRYQIDTNGVFVDGRPPHNALGCSAYGQDAHPGFGNKGGAVAVTFFEHGARVLEVDRQGRISERGGFLPLGGNSAQPRWITDDLLYVIDMHRGIDILRMSPQP